MRHIDLKPIEDQPAPQEEFALEEELLKQRIREHLRQLETESTRLTNVAVHGRQAERGNRDFVFTSLKQFAVASGITLCAFTLFGRKDLQELVKPPAPPKVQATQSPVPPPPLYTVKDITDNLRYYEFRDDTTGLEDIKEAVSSLYCVIYAQWAGYNLHVNKSAAHQWDDRAIDAAIKAAIAAHGGGK